MKYIPAEKLITEIKHLQEKFPVATYDALYHLITSLQQEQPEVSVECYVRVYPTLDNKPRPWVALCRHGIGCNSIRDIPELETLGFKDDDTAIVTIKKK